MPDTITFKGNAMTLMGRKINTGLSAPYFRVVSQDLKEITLSDFGEKIKLISSFPSLDTPVCDLQVKEFNKRASGFSADIVVVGISKDLPFAQKRFCQENSIKNEIVLSDYRYSSFGINYGLLIKELNLLARSVHILDKNNIVRYSQIVPELTNAPDYEDALKSLQDVLKGPAYKTKESLPSKCKPCEAGTPPIPKDEIEKLLARHKTWQLADDKKITREFRFKDFVEAKYFVDMISVISEEQGHHPTITLMYNKVKITLATHVSGGLTENDFIMAGIFDEVAASA